MILDETVEIKRKYRFWTKEKCQEVALLCKTKKEFNKKYPVAYSASVKNKWLNEISTHLTAKIKPMRYWTKEKCHELALKCETRYEFQKKYHVAYIRCFDNNWLSDVCSHMKICGNIYKRLVYMIEFDDNTVYIGLTCNSNRRFREHIKQGPVYKHILESKITPKIKTLTEYLDINDAIVMEEYYITYYKRLGYRLLNKVKAGGLGYDISKNLKSKWNYNTCKEEALKYNSRSEFATKCQRAYRIARKNNWIDDLYPVKRCKKINS